jgi:LAO/AO transport system kinase
VVKIDPIDKKYVDQLFEGILGGDRLALARAITLIESEHIDHHDLALELVEKCLEQKQNSIRIGITGTPGVGKSTFIEALGKQYLDKDHRLAILTVDPTSPFNQGSILGDKSRMDFLSNHKNAFVRSSPSRTKLGGTTDRTRETIALCESCGYDVIFVETVGVGQSETEIQKMVDFVILLVLPGSGDEIQGIKRGIVEIADLIVVNKEDRNDPAVVKDTLNAYTFALHLKKAKKNRWASKAVSCSSLKETGIIEIGETLDTYFQNSKQKEFLQQNRNDQNTIWFQDQIRFETLKMLEQKMYSSNDLSEIKEKVRSGKLSPIRGAKNLIKQLF